MVFIPHEETEQQEEGLVSGKGSKKRKPAGKAFTSKTVAQPRIWNVVQVAGVHGRKPRSNPASNSHAAVGRECIKFL